MQWKLRKKLKVNYKVISLIKDKVFFKITKANSLSFEIKKKIRL